MYPTNTIVFQFGGRPFCTAGTDNRPSLKPPWPIQSRQFTWYYDS